MKNILKLSLIAFIIASSFLHAEVTSDKPLSNNLDENVTNQRPQRNVNFFSEITGKNTVTGIRSHYEQGYLIESGKFKNSKNEVISFFIGVSQKNDLTAIIELPNKMELITINHNGKKRVISVNKNEFSLEHDFIPTDEKVTSENVTPNLTETKIEFLAAYSTTALGNLASAVDFDPIIHALLQLETAALGMRNSKIENIELTLGGVLILNTGDNYNTSSEGLRNWQNIMDPYRDLYKTDMNFAMTTVLDNGGIAYVPGWTSASGWNQLNAFRHELGHNVGGSHCNVEGTDNYKFGYNNGQSKTFLCGNNSPYYSTPNVIDDYGLPLGNAKTADMARLWREQASRMSGYNTPLEGVKFIFVSREGLESRKFTLEANSNPSAGFVALYPYVGPTQLEELPPGGFTTLNVLLKDIKGDEYGIVFRAQRQLNTCPIGAMNRTARCEGGGPLSLILTYDPADNPDLPAKTYNGLLQLRAKDSGDPNYNILVNLPLSIVVP